MSNQSLISINPGKSTCRSAFRKLVKSGTIAKNDAVYVEYLEWERGQAQTFYVWGEVKSTSDRELVISEASDKEDCFIPIDAITTFKIYSFSAYVTE